MGCFNNNPLGLKNQYAEMIRINCISKDNGDHYDPHEAIQKFGWVDVRTNETGICTLAQMIDFLEKGGVGYTQDFLGRKAYLVVRVSRHGNKYVKTVADGVESDNLLYLNECSVVR